MALFQRFPYHRVMIRQLLYRTLFLAAFLAVFSSCYNSNYQGREWISLFNGKDLTGWKVECLEADREKTFWEVSDGAIECNSLGQEDHDYVWLVSNGEYSDFELKFQFQAFRDSPGNSGIQIRSRYDNSPDAPHGGWLDGPQVDIHPQGPWRIGLNSDETREEKRWIYPSLPDWRISRNQGQKGVSFKFSDEEDGWNSMRIRCDGMRIQVWINGERITNFDGTGILDNEAHRRHDVGTAGHIALQLHKGDSLRMRFREIKIRDIN